MGAVGEFRRRRQARRWQHWSEVDPEDDFLRLSRIVTVIAVAFMLLVFGMIVLGLVLALS